ncbi:class I SAM-dependent methyltransferase [Tolypothrix campylonemoides VB511288]|nr:class I SAM-dependent methyltransferase [Tolypothrix campylonemoides VB511288]
MNLPKCESRTLEQVKEHYEIEKDLASKLRNASKEERQYLYTSLYDELFQRVQHHPQLLQKASSQEQARAITFKMNLLKRFLHQQSIFLEVGPGDCSLAFNVARYVKKVYAVDVSYEITANSVKPENFQLMISDGCSIPVPKNSVDVVYSDNVIEHLHPDDALAQLQNIYHALNPGGVFICVTPNRFYGPHDISRYFDKVATGFHLKEYTISELAEICKMIGFKKLQMMLSVKEFVLPILLPVFPFRWLEAVLHWLPTSASQQVSRWFPIKILLHINLVATK